MKLKTSPVTIKAAGVDDGLEEGQFVGYASVFGNKDSYGDVIVKGAFAESLASYGENGAGIPAYWSHRMDDPDMNIGKTIEAREDDHGLLVKVQIDLESPKGAQVHRLIKDGRVSQMSFAYDVEEGAFVDEKDAEGNRKYYYELRKLKLHEVSVVAVGANQETELLTVKNGQVEISGKGDDVHLSLKLGRTLSASTESKIKAARDALNEVLGVVEEEESDDESVSDEEPKGGKPEEPETAKGEDRLEVKARNGNPDAVLALINVATLATFNGKEA